MNIKRRSKCFDSKNKKKNINLSIKILSIYCRDAFSVTLWYLMLGKKTILATLFKKDREQQKTYEFLMNDFKEQR